MSHCYPACAPRRRRRDVVLTTPDVANATGCSSAQDEAHPLYESSPGSFRASSVSREEPITRGAPLIHSLRKNPPQAPVSWLLWSLIGLTRCATPLPAEPGQEAPDTNAARIEANGGFAEVGGYVRIEAEAALRQNSAFAYQSARSDHDWVGTDGVSGTAVSCLLDNGASWVTTSSPCQ